MANLMNFTDYGQMFSIYFIYLLLSVPFWNVKLKTFGSFINLRVIQYRHE